MRVNLDDDEQFEVNMAPLLDCIFLLLIFFLVATSFNKLEPEKKQEELKIVLPHSAVALESHTAAEQVLVIGVDRHGRLFLNGQRVGSEALHDAIKREAAGNRNRRIRIDGDRDAKLQHIVQVLDLCEFEGLRNVSIRADSDARY
jgi:biopolymer transport protein ExbD